MNREMAVLALTKEGKALAHKLTAAFPGEVMGFLPEKLWTPIDTWAQPYSGSLSEGITPLFHRYRGLIFIMATGIVVRIIAPLVRDKRIDPAVVVMDEKGRFIISLLSGHLGGANELAIRIGKQIGAQPVITTATDVQGKVAVDLLAKEYDFVLEPFENLKLINGAMVNDSPVVFLGDGPLPGIEVKALENWTDDEAEAVVLATNRRLPSPKKPYIFLRPKNLWAGIGCRRGTKAEEIITAINIALEETKKSPYSLAGIGTAWLKDDELGLQKAARILQLPIIPFGPEELQGVMNGDITLKKSAWVQAKIGVDGVCEPAALLASRGKLIMPKRICGRVTVALAEGPWPWSVSDRETENT